jgi:hypothetical protein
MDDRRRLRAASNLGRRDFVKLGGVGAAAVGLAASG